MKERDGRVAELEGSLEKLREKASQARSQMQAQITALQEVKQLLLLFAPTIIILGTLI